MRAPAPAAGELFLRVGRGTVRAAAPIAGCQTSPLGGPAQPGCSDGDRRHCTATCRRCPVHQPRPPAWRSAQHGATAACPCQSHASCSSLLLNQQPSLVTATASLFLPAVQLALPRGLEALAQGCRPLAGGRGGGGAGRERVQQEGGRGGGFASKRRCTGGGPWQRRLHVQAVWPALCVAMAGGCLRRLLC